MRSPFIAPAVEPVTLAEARLQCRFDAGDTSWDTRLSAFIVAARNMAEHEIGQRLITQTWQLQLDGWPAGDGGIVLPQTPVQSVVSLVYVNSAGTPITLTANTAYRLDTRGELAVIRPAYNTSWPTDTLQDSAVITATYVVGFGASGAAVPQSIREWILAHVAAMCEQPAAVSEMGTRIAALPYLARLLDPWRVYSGRGA